MSISKDVGFLVVLLMFLAAWAGPPDGDGDGVDDAHDVCPTTPAEVAVDSEGRPQADLDRDCDVDLDDHRILQASFTGPGEICDGFDDDGDGLIDEDFDVGAPCGMGVCAGGSKECLPDGTGTRCDTQPGGSADQSSPEGCDGLDNDCDGAVDGGDSDGDGVGELCDLCPGGDDHLDPDSDGHPSFCDNCPQVANPGQEDGDPACEGDVPESAKVPDLGNLCDNCDFICNDQADSHGIRATAIIFVSPNASDCTESASFTGETQDLDLGDDALSHTINLDDENGDGNVNEVGDFDFRYFGKKIEYMRISTNGVVYLLEAGQQALEPPVVAQAGAIPLFDGVDNMIAAAWTDLEASTADAPGTAPDPCVSFQILGANTTANQVVEITWENMLVQGGGTLSSQVLLREIDDTIEIHTNIQNASGNITRGAEGLLTLNSTQVVAASFLPGEVQGPFASGMSAVRIWTSPIPEGSPNLESGDECDNAIVLPLCGDGACHLDGETTENCPADCPP